MKKFLATRLPFLVPLKRLATALADGFAPTKRSYAQDGEDTLAQALLAGRDCSNATYVDVGANHPTKISNTYLFYRTGWSGITVEPNRTYRWLHRLLRPRDTFVNVGIARAAALLPFFHQTWAVLSGFGQQSTEGSCRNEYLPVVPLDALLPVLGMRPLTVLSVDVEGLNLEVLQGGPEMLRRAEIVVVEFGAEEQELVELLRATGHEVRHRTPHNLITQRLVSSLAGEEERSTRAT